MGEKLIEVRSLTKVFGDFRAVDNISFDIGRGEIFGFLGPNGAGKSTAIRMLCGILSPTSGTALVGGFDINSQPEQVREHIGYMSQKFSLYRDLTVIENMRFFGGVYGLEGNRLKERIDAIIAMARLGGMENRLAGNLSGAVQQRLALGCAVLHEPPILFLDEPTSGVDPISRRFFWDLIQDLSGRGVTVLITTHFMDEAEFCGRIGFISGGQLVALNTPADLRNKSVEEDLFEVALGELAGAREKVLGVEGVVSASYFGSRLHVFCIKNMFNEKTLAAAAGSRGLKVESLKKAQVTLEDAFVRLVEKQAGGKAA